MAIIATEGKRFTDVVKWEEHEGKGVTREVVTVNEAADTVYGLGTVLGKAADGTYKRVEATADDGSEIADAIYIGTGDLGEAKDLSVAADTDTKVLVLKRGKAIVSEAGLEFGASVDTPAEKAAQFEALKALGIFVEKTIG